MKHKDKNNEGFNINVYGSGNFIAENITFDAPVYIGSHNKASVQNGFTDEQVARAIEAICGEGKPLDSKQKWAGVQWLLRWECNYPPRAREFCERIARLPLSEDLAYRCEYNNIRPYSTLSFLNDDPRQINNVKYSKNDEAAFLQLREVAMALHQELQKTNID